MKLSAEQTVILGVGDVGPDRDDASGLFDLNRDVLTAADLSICQLEFVLSEKGERLPQVRHTARAKPADALAIFDGGFNAVTLAGNHCMDFGAAAMLDTARILTDTGLAVAGVGENVSSAREPAIISVGGKRVALLSFASVMPQDFWATSTRPGCAPARAFTFYEQIELDQPGTPARVHTFPHRDDLRALIESIHSARATADIVIVGMHWGIHFIPAVIADYQKDYAHAIIDAGADAIFGHHAHILKGVEVYRGKPIFYSLGNFAMDTWVTPAQAESTAFREIMALNPEWIPDFSSSYNFPPDSRKTIIARLVFDNNNQLTFGFIPGWINSQSQTEVLTPGDPRFHEVVSYMSSISDSAGLATSYTVTGDLVIPEAGAE